MIANSFSYNIPPTSLHLLSSSARLQELRKRGQSSTTVLICLGIFEEGFLSCLAEWFNERRLVLATKVASDVTAETARQGKEKHL